MTDKTDTETDTELETDGEAERARDDSIRCTATNRNGERCGRIESWDSKCRYHRGTSADGSSHYDNTNRVTHGLYAKESTFYSKIANDNERQLVDEIFRDYYEMYRERHGEPPRGHEQRLFQIAVSMVKEIHGERWFVERPESAQSPNALVDGEVNYSNDGNRFIKHKESVVLKGIRQLSGDSRQWLKELELLPSAQTRAAATVGLCDLFAALDEPDEDGDGDGE